ncbi:MAG: electron transport complex subunit RsxC [candidate division WOR-3 bacterium]|nr:electron transport complex subunit RsxC [candidate division WOR-3 bacterium]
MFKVLSRNRPFFGFKGGVHPKEFKELSAHKPIEKAPIPKRVFRPYIQHTGIRTKPIISIGDTVKVGTKIGEAEGYISVPIHASISGKVIDISEIDHPVLPTRTLTCVIESDGQDIWEENIKERDYQNFSREELISIIRDAGIVGLGGAAFPTYVKLSPPKEKPIDTLIINGCECEPYLTADHRLMLEKPNEIFEGAKIIAKILNVSQVIIGIEDNKPDAIKVMKQSISQDNRFSVVGLKTKYPQGAEKQLIKALLNRKVPSGGLPMDVGALVQNVGTALAVYEACRFNKPLIERVVTVTGSCIREPKNLLVRLGTPVYDLINFCGGYIKEPAKIIFGGPMMGIAQYNDELPIIKGTSGIVILSQEEVKVSEEAPCIRCARCVSACPMDLLPCELNNFIRKKEFEKAQAYNLFDCIECGCCAYVCPAKIKLVHAFIYAKRELRDAYK